MLIDGMLLEVKTGELAALLTTICWTICALCFEYSSKKVGSLSVNLLRLYLAFVLFSIFSYLFRGRALPTDASGDTWLWLGLSGLIGFVLGDLFLFKAFVIMGARTSMLIMALTPIATALMGYLILSETLILRHGIGMVMTISGVAAVILTRKDGSKELKHPPRGIVYAFIGMLGQAVGLVLSKYGMGQYSAFAATHIRIIAGIIGFSVLFFYFRAWGRFAASFKNPRAILFLVLGSIFGPFLGVYLSLLAVQHTSTGIASTIMSIVPVLIIPFAVVLFKENVNAKEIVGAVIAVIGTGIMFS